MARSHAATVKEYLEELPEDRRAVVEAVRKVILKNLPAGYCELMNWGAITYAVPLKRYPDTYNGEPLCYAALAAQKNHYAVYLMSVYGGEDQQAWFREEYRKSGKKLDMGKSCVRFKKLEDLPLELIGRVIARTPPDEWIACYEASRRR
jgi:hypothetical protein